MSLGCVSALNSGFFSLQVCRFLCPKHRSLFSVKWHRVSHRESVQSTCGMFRIQLVELVLFPSTGIGMASFRLVGMHWLCDDPISDILGIISGPWGLRRTIPEPAFYRWAVSQCSNTFRNVWHVPEPWDMCHFGLPVSRGVFKVRNPTLKSSFPAGRVV